MTAPGEESGYQPGDSAANQFHERLLSDSNAYDEELDQLIVQRTPFPGAVLAAGLFWLVAGAFYVGLFALSRLLKLPIQNYEIWLLICAAFFIKDGIQLIVGRFRDPLGDGIFSILFALYLALRGANDFAEDGKVFPLILRSFLAFLFLIPGTLVLMGRKQFLVWKAEQA